MVKKIGIILLSIALISTGAWAFRKLHYWERSVSIFNYTKAERNFEGRGGRGYGRFEDRRDRSNGEGTGERPDFRERGEFRERPDFRERSDSGRRADFRERTEFRDRAIRDSTFRSREGPNREVEGRAIFERRDRDSHGRGGFGGRKKVRLRNVLWFLAVFAGFTTGAIYLDNLQLSILKKKKSTRI